MLSSLYTDILDESFDVIKPSLLTILFLVSDYQYLLFARFYSREFNRDMGKCFNVSTKMLSKVLGLLNMFININKTCSHTSKNGQMDSRGNRIET